MGYSLQILVALVLLVLQVHCQLRSTSIIFPDDMDIIRPEANNEPPLSTLFRPTRKPESYINSFKSVSDIVSTFAWKSFRASKLPNPLENVVMCSLLPQYLLSILDSGAEGETKEEIRQVIGAGNRESASDLYNLLDRIRQTRSDNEVIIAGALFPDQHLRVNQSFVNEASSRNIGLYQVNFSDKRSSESIINSWVTQATRGLINQIYRKDDLSQPKLVLASTIYFNGVWREPFKTVITNRFYPTPKSANNIEFLKDNFALRTSEFNTGSGSSAIWVELPYKQNEFSMVIIIPKVKHSLDQLIRSMDPDDLISIINELDNDNKADVILQLPKFSVKSSFSLKTILLKLGLVNLFTDLSNLPYVTMNHEPLKVSDILQFSVLNVNQTGTTAASATVVNAVPLSAPVPLPSVTITVDQPFLSLIVDKRNKVPLFISKIFNP